RKEQYPSALEVYSTNRRIGFRANWRLDANICWNSKMSFFDIRTNCHQIIQTGIKAQALTLINALPLCSFRAIYSVDCKEGKSVKETALFEPQVSLSFLAKERLKGKQSVATDREAVTSGFSFPFCRVKKERV
ncbi:MAG: hypothetical protein PF439_07110, partial [Helicobacteraceae bacterium]|nr:hypothetical protein [Helicobacteraceae bacterium]